MKIPLSWLKETIDLPYPSHQIGDMLTLAGLEVDGIETQSPGFSHVVVAEVTHTESHPEADKLCVATVTDGMESYQVVCGAPNCRPGLRTAYAKVGARLGETKIKKTKLRGVVSYGMLCAEDELGLSDDHEKIIEFEDHIPLGEDLATVYGDEVIEISLTPNLNHCASVMGVARELAASTGNQVKLPEVKVTEDGGSKIDSFTSVTIDDFTRCPRYSCRVIQNVKIAPSPEWMQERLIASGLRPVNNVVDITNYVLLEMGHPLHAFDFDKLDGKKIVVRTAKEGEQFETLDHKSRTLTAEDLLICDGAGPVAIAGVMGGLHSEVSESTVNVLLESAFFQPRSIRRTSKLLGLSTDSSKRFERGCDPNQVLRSLDRATMLIQELAGGKVVSGILDLKQGEFPMHEVTCRLSKINAILGTDLGVSEVETIFQRLEMHVEWNETEGTFYVKAPTYRFDIQSEIDLVEEVARIYGFENLPKPSPKYSHSDLPHAPIYLFENKVRSRLLAEGLQEFLTCDLIGPTILAITEGSIMPEEAVAKVMNPTSIEQSVLRTSLMPGLLQVVKHNTDRGNRNIHGFEIGRIHFKDGEQFREQSMAAIVLSGNSAPLQWDKETATVDFYDLKGIIESFLNELGIQNYRFQTQEVKQFHPGRQAAIYVNGQEIGSMGEVHPSIVRRLDVPQRIYFAELDLHELIQRQKVERKMEEIPLFPGSDRDWTVTVPEEMPIQEIFDAVGEAPSRLLESYQLKYIYRSEQLGKDKKNVTLHFVYRDKKKTIAQETVEAEHERIIKKVESRIGR